MPGTSYKVRATLAIWSRGLWRYRLTAIGTILAIFGAATALNNLPKVISAAAAVAGLLVAILEIRANHRRALKLRFQARETDDYRDVTSQEKPHGRIVRTPRDVGIVLREEGKQLRRDVFRAEVEAEDYKLHRSLKQYSFDYLARGARKRAMHNDPVLGLSSDVVAQNGTAVVKLHRAMYFDFFCSNLLAPFDIYESGRQTPLLSGRRLFVDRRGNLRKIAESRLANVVGVSTLAFTKDGKIILVLQTDLNVGSPGLVAPSGSGALEPKDVPRDNDGQQTFSAVLLNGVERELQEECNIQPHEILSSCLMGYARWISRGAMPEFCAVTLLDLTSDEVLARNIRRPERAFVQEVVAARLTPAEMWHADEPLAMLPDAYQLATSWPLVFGLSCLAECMEDEDWSMRTPLMKMLS